MSSEEIRGLFDNLCDDVIGKVLEFMESEDLYKIGWVNPRLRRLSLFDRHWTKRIEADVHDGKILPDFPQIRRILRMRKTMELGEHFDQENQVSEGIELDDEVTIRVDERERKGTNFDGLDHLMLVHGGVRAWWEDGRRNFHERSVFVEKTSFLYQFHSRVFFFMLIFLPIFSLALLFIVMLLMIFFVRDDILVYVPMSLVIISSCLIVQSISVFFCYYCYISNKYNAGLRFIRIGTKIVQEQFYIRHKLNEINGRDEGEEFPEFENRLEREIEKRGGLLNKLDHLININIWIHVVNLTNIFILSAIGVGSSTLMGSILFLKIGLFSFVPVIFITLLIMILLLVVFIYHCKGDQEVSYDLPKRIMHMMMYCGFYSCLCFFVLMITIQFITIIVYFSIPDLPELKWSFIFSFTPSLLFFFILLCGCPFCCLTCLLLQFIINNFIKIDTCVAATLQYSQMCQLFFGWVSLFLYCFCAIPMIFFIISYIVLYITGAWRLIFLVFLPLMVLDCCCMILICSLTWLSHSFTWLVNETKTIIAKYRGGQ